MKTLKTLDLNELESASGERSLHGRTMSMLGLRSARRTASSAELLSVASQVRRADRSL